MLLCAAQRGGGGGGIHSTDEVYTGYLGEGGRGGGGCYLSEFTPDVAASGRATFHDHKTHSVRTEAQDACLDIPGQGRDHLCMVAQTTRVDILQKSLHEE